MGGPFDLSDAVIRDLSHVRVTRSAPRNGRPCQYVKVFKPGGLGNAAYWVQRENDFLLYFSLHKLKSVVEFANISQTADGIHTPVIDSVTTVDAGITIADWLSVQARYANGVAARHPFWHIGPFLELIRACLEALREIHRCGIVHCDIKEDNICLPYAPYPLPPGQAVSIHFGRLRLIDFAFSISHDRPLERPLPILVLAGGHTYQSKLLQTAITKDRSNTQGSGIHAQQLDYRVDLYSLGHMAGRILQAGFMQPVVRSDCAAVEGAHQLAEQLKAFDNGRERADEELPHGRLIAGIDRLLKSVDDAEAFRQFMVAGVQTNLPYAPPPLTPVAPVTGTDGTVKPRGVKEEKPDETVKHSKHTHHLITAAQLIGGLGGLGGLYLLYNMAMHYGYLDWTGLCRLLGEDRQIRECQLWPGSEKVGWRGATQYPFRLPALPTFPGDNSVVSADGLLAVGLPSKSYHKGDSLEIQAAVSIPLYLRIYHIDAAGKIDQFYLGLPAKKPIEPGTIVKYPPPHAILSNEIDSVGAMKIVAIASENPFPKDMELLDGKGKLTEQAALLSPTVVRLGYLVKGK